MNAACAAKPAVASTSRTSSVWRLAAGLPSPSQPRSGIAFGCTSAFARRARARLRVAPRIAPRRHCRLSAPEPDLAKDRLREPLQERPLAGDVVVERHRLDVQFRGELPHAQPVEPVCVHQPERRGEDPAAIEGTRPGLLRGAAGAGSTSRRVDHHPLILQRRSRSARVWVAPRDLCDRSWQVRRRRLTTQSGSGVQLRTRPETRQGAERGRAARMPSAPT